MSYLHLALLASALVLPAPLAAHPDDFAKVLAAPSRQAEHHEMDAVRHPAEILDFADVPKGATVIDMMAGSGFYTELIADVVGPKGIVYASNPPNFHDGEKWVPIQKAHPNIRMLVVPMKEAVLAPRSVDVIFTHTIYHDLYWESERAQYPRLDVPEVLRGWHTALRPGGTIVVVDHAGPPGDPRENAAKLHRIDPEQVKADMASIGMVLVAEGTMLRRSDDDYAKSVFDPSVSGKTDRIVLKFKKM